MPARYRPNLAKGARLTLPVLPLVYFLFVRLANIPNYDSIGVLSYKDAAAWKLCAKALSLTGSFPDGYGNWCNRRPFFAEISGVLFRLTGSDFMVLLILTLIFCASLFFLIRELDGLLGVLSQAIVVVLSLILWLLFGANLFLSESLAIPIGLTFVTLILNFIRTQSILSLSCAAFSVSLLQNTRPSNFFLILVPLFFLAIYRKNRQGFVPVIVATISPFLLISLAGKITRISEYNNAGNAWATLYGLFHKNSDWTLAYAKLSQSATKSDYEVSKRIEELVLIGLREDPLQSVMNFIFSLISNLSSMIISDHLFFLPDNLAIPFIGSLLSILLFIFIAWRIVKLRFGSVHLGAFTLALSVTTTTVLSYATFWKSEASRVLSSTLIFALIILLIPTFRSNKTIHSSEEKRSSTKIVVAMMCTIVIGVLLIASNHSDRNPSKGKLPISCTAGEFYFLNDSMTTQSVEEVKFFGLYEWEQNVKELSDGYLSQGLGVFGNDVNSIQTYSKVKLSPNRCYTFSLGGSELPALIKLGFGYSS